jgi:hypothetical protein
VNVAVHQPGYQRSIRRIGDDRVFRRFHPGSANGRDPVALDQNVGSKRLASPRVDDDTITNDLESTCHEQLLVLLSVHQPGFACKSACAVAARQFNIVTAYSAKVITSRKAESAFMS